MKPQKTLNSRSRVQYIFLAIILYSLWSFWSTDPLPSPAPVNNVPVMGPHHPIRGAAPFSYPEHCFQMGSVKACYKIGSDTFRNPCITDPKDSSVKLCLPFFSIIGFPGANVERVTSLLSQHPQIQMQKTFKKDSVSPESGIMNKENIGVKAYASSFPYISNPNDITGEVALSYATSPSIPSRLKQIVPYLRVIVFIRDPVTQLQEYHRNIVKDDYNQQMKEADRKPRLRIRHFDEYVREPSETTECFEKYQCEDPEKWDIDCTQNCQRLGRFVHADWLEPWITTFDDNQVLVIRMEDFENEPERVMRLIEEHLFIQKNNYDYKSILNVKKRKPAPGDNILMRMLPKKTAKPRVKTMDYRIQNPLSIDKVGYNYSSIDVETNQYLRKFYQPHIDRLEKLLKRPLRYPNPVPDEELYSPDTKKHCFDYGNDVEACYTTGPDFKTPCFYVDGQRKCLPYFVIIGWPKSGTSSLYYYMTQHPYAMTANVKETDYFQHWITKNLGPKYYASLFPPIRHPEMITGEATSKYGHELRTAENMIKMLPHVKLIAMLRDPTEQIYSNHLMINDVLVEQGGKGNPPFETVVNNNKQYSSCISKKGCNFDEPENWNPECTYSCPKFGSTIYVDWLEHWLKIYPKEQLMVILTEELEADSKGVVEEVREYLGLPKYDFSTILKTVVNVRGAKRGIYSVVNATMYDETRKIGDPYSLETRLKLAQFFEPHNKRLAKLLGRETLPWMTPERVAELMKQEAEDKDKQGK